MGMDDDMGMDEPSMNPMESRLKAMEEELFAMRAAAKAADQNDPDGETLGAKGKSEDQEKKEEEAANKEARSAPFLAMFDAYDTDNDGFVTSEDWGGPRAMFASLDTDSDGIIARHEVMAGEVPEAFKKQWDKGDDDKDDDKDDKKDDKKASDDEDEDDKGKEASKLAFGHEADFDEDELEMLSAMQFDEAPEDEVMGCGDVMASKKAKKSDDDEEVEVEVEESDDDDDSDEGSDKEASGDAEFFATGFDPMGLSDGTTLTAADKAAFNDVFGSDDDDDADEDEGSDKEASLASLLQPQKRTASKGVKSVGNVPKVASKKTNEVAELSSLWASDPDVSGSFS